MTCRDPHYSAYSCLPATLARHAISHTQCGGCEGMHGMGVLVKKPHTHVVPFPSELKQLARFVWFVLRARALLWGEVSLSLISTCMYAHPFTSCIVWVRMWFSTLSVFPWQLFKSPTCTLDAACITISLA